MIKKANLTRRVPAVLILTVLLVSLLSFPAFAGWRGSSGRWWYEYSDGSYPYNVSTVIDGVRYVFDSDGYLMEDRWVQMNGDNWYYCTKGGPLARDTWIGDYYVGSDMAMLTDAWTPDGYYVGSDGKWVPGKTRNSGQNSSFDMSQYELIGGTYDNRDQQGFWDDHRVDCFVTLSDSHVYMNFGLYDITGTSYDLYDKYNPNGDSLELYPGSDSFHWTAKSTIRKDTFSLEYNGKDTIVLHWRHPTWLGSKDIIFKRRSYLY